MIIEILIFIFLGIILGTITGLIPGIHVNLISLIILSLSGKFLLNLNSIYLIVIISSMAITHTFLDFIPSIFLGCPDTDTELSTLPGHSLLKQGKGYEAVSLTLYGSLVAIFLLLIISFPSVLLIKKFYFVIKTIIPYLLVISSLFLIILEKEKLNSLFVFILSGVLGLSVLNMNINQPLLPLLTGLFGGSILIISIKNKIKIPKQKITKPKIRIIRPSLGALFSAPLCSFLPGFGSGQAAVIGSLLLKQDENNKENFLFLVGAINTLVMGFSFITLYTISKTRTGVAAAIKEIIGTMPLKILLLIFVVSLISGIISFFWAMRLTKIFSKEITKINYTKASIIVLIFLSVLVFWVSGLIGLLVFIVSSLLGVYSSTLRIRRISMMGSLIIPTIILYLKI